MNRQDKEILHLYRLENKEKAFNILVENYKRPLYWHIRKIVVAHSDADDVLQNTFIKVWKNLATFREEAKLSTWIYRIATNESLNFLNSARKSKLMPINNIQEYLLDNLASDPYINGEEIEIKLQEAIIRLPEKQRLVFNMRYFDNIKFDDMAKILNTSSGALKASYHHARKKLEQFLKDSN